MQCTTESEIRMNQKPVQINWLKYQDKVSEAHREITETIKYSEVELLDMLCLAAKDVVQAFIDKARQLPRASAAQT